MKLDRKSAPVSFPQRLTRPPLRALVRETPSDTQSAPLFLSCVRIVSSPVRRARELVEQQELGQGAGGPVPLLPLKLTAEGGIRGGECLAAMVDQSPRTTEKKKKNTCIVYLDD